MKKIYLILFVILYFSSPLLSQVFSIPYTDDFETGSPGWSVIGSPGWELGMPNYGTTNTTHSGNNCWDIVLNGSYFNVSGSELYSPAIDVSWVSGVKISFWQNRNVEANWDGFRIEYTDATSSGPWVILGSYNSFGSQNWYNCPTLYSTALPGWTGASNGWEQSSIIAVFPYPVIHLRFVFTGDPSVTLDGVSIDDFSIEAVAMNSVNGTVYVDANYNSVIDTGDFPAQNVTMNSVPNAGYYYAPTNANGDYTFFVDSAVNTTITPVLPPYSTAIPPSITVNIPGSGQVSSGNDFLLTFQPGITDPQITITSTPVRPGFSHYKTLDLYNSGTTFVSGTVELTYDAAYTLVSTSDPYTVIGTNVIEFIYTGLMPGEHRSILVEFSTSPTLTLGQTTSASAVIFPINGDQNTSNNYSSITTTTVNSCDPNNKLVDPEGDILIQDVAAGTDLHYTINFQNTGTASAVYVNIFDVLDNNLDISTFEVTGFSHPLTSWNIGSNRQVQFSFTNINLPDSTTNEQESHGFVSYKIQPYTSLALGSQITNTASIVFDFNQPIATNSVTSTVVIPVGIQEIDAMPVYLYPNPASEQISFKAAEKFTRYRILNAMGQLVAENIITQPGQTQTVSLGNLPSGLYILMVSDNYSNAKTPFMIE